MRNWCCSCVNGASGTRQKPKVATSRYSQELLEMRLSVCVCSLVRALTSEYYQSSGTQGERITDGIDITTWDVKRNDDSVVFSVWDFAGQTVYYNTHQVRITFRPRC